MVAPTLTGGESRWEMALGSLGVITALAVIASPWSKFRNIARTKEIGRTKAYPYLAVLFNSEIWVIFAIPAIRKLVHDLVHHRHPGLTDYLGIPLLIANGVGVFVELWYVYVFLRYAVGKRKAPAAILCIVIVVPAGVLAILLGVKCSRTFVGYIAMFSGAAMYAIPVYDTIRAYKANELSEISVYQASASLANGVVWTAYSCIHRVRAFVFVPNLTAVVCAGGQLVARVFLKRKIAKEAEAQRAEELAEAQRLRDLESGRAGSGSGHVQLTEQQQEKEAQRAAELAEAQRLRDQESGRAGSGSGHVQITEAQQDEEARSRAPAQDMKLGDGTGEAAAAAQQLAKATGGAHQNTEIVADEEMRVILAPGADGGSIKVDNQLLGTGKTTVAPGGGASSGTVDNQVHGQEPADGDEHDGDEHDSDKHGSDKPGGDDAA